MTGTKSPAKAAALKKSSGLANDTSGHKKDLESKPEKRGSCGRVRKTDDSKTEPEEL